MTQGVSGGNSLARRVVLFFLLLSSILLTNHYRSALRSEFTIMSEAHLNLTSIPELDAFKLFLLFDGSKCQEFRQLGHSDQLFAGRAACAKRSQEYDECIFLHKADRAAVLTWIVPESNQKDETPYRWHRVRKMKSIWDNLIFTCVDDIPSVVMETNKGTGKVKTAFISSEANFGAAFIQFAGLTKEFPHEIWEQEECGG